MGASFHRIVPCKRNYTPRLSFEDRSFFTKTTYVGQDLTWNNAKPSVKALTEKVEGAIG